jgi:UDP-N-acetylglucosamine:LPS N-acetylglucosamine transferase
VANEPRNVLILSADIGEGHDAPARAIQREFREEEPEARVMIANGLTAMGGILTSVVRDSSVVTFKWFPWIFEVQYWLLMKIPPTRWLSQKLLSMLGARPLMRIINAHNPDLIISTYPGVTSVLGNMRLNGKLLTPTIADITDLAGLHHWAHKGIDLHTVTHRESTETVERIAGKGSVRWAQPPTTPAFLNPPTREEARGMLGLPVDCPVIIVSGGGWGVGDVTGGIEDALAVANSRVVALCGRNDSVKAALEAKFGREPRLRIEGFTSEMATFLSAGDVLIHATGGLTALEAMICGTKVISYGFGIGHVRENNKEYLHLGLAQVVKKRAELPAAIAEALEQPTVRDPRYAQLPTAATLSREMTRWVEPIPTWRLVGRRVLVGIAAFAAIAWLALGSGFGFNFADGPLRLKTVTDIPTDQPIVAVIANGVEGSQAADAALLNAAGLHASVAVAKPLPAESVAAMKTAGSTPLPQLRKSGAVRWLATRARLKKLARNLGLSKPFAYQPPAKGFSVGEYEAAKSVGGKPVKGKIVVTANSTIGNLERGEIVTIILPGGRESATAIDELKRALAKQHLRSVPLSELVK